MIEDNLSVLVLNEKLLRRKGYIVRTAKTLAEARNHLKAEKFDLILLDAMLPDGDGFEFLHYIRSRTDIPVLMVTSKTATKDIVQGLMNGADDYLTKPYRIEELHARVVALLRRKALREERLDPDNPHCGPITLELAAGRALFDGEDMMLSQKEFALLHFFVKNEGKFLTKEQIYEYIWHAPADTDTRVIWTLISRLRQKLGKDGCFQIESKRGEGYRLCYIR